MGMVDGTGLITWEGGLFTPDSALLPRVQWAFQQIRADGGTITLNEAGRPFGVFSDRYATDASGTASGRSTVNFQWGRYLRGETPSAANPAVGPYASEHTQGIAIDCNAAQPSLRAKYFAMVGLSNTIASESWHWAIRGPSQVDLSGFEFAAQNVTKITEKPRNPFEEENDMYVWTNSDYGKSYSVTNGSAQHHNDGLTKSIALKSIGGADREIKLEDGELAFALGSMGLGMYVDPNLHLTRFSDPHWNGRQFLAPWQDGGKFYDEFRSYHKL